jgi:hypothetical protein
MCLCWSDAQHQVPLRALPATTAAAAAAYYVLQYLCCNRLAKISYAYTVGANKDKLHCLMRMHWDSTTACTISTKKCNQAYENCC